MRRIIIRGCDVQPNQPTNHPHFLPGMKFMYGNIRASITHVEYHDQQLEALPWRHFVGKCILALATEAARWKYALERPFPFPAPFVSSRLPSPREPVVEPKPLESSSTTLQAFTTTNHLLRTIYTSSRIFRPALDSRDPPPPPSLNPAAPRNVCSCFMHARWQFYEVGTDC